MVNNIIELIDSLLPQNLIDIYYTDAPPDKECLVIEESLARSKVECLQGFDGVITSNIQFYAKIKVEGDYYNNILKVLKRFYILVYEQQGSKINDIEIKQVGDYEISPCMRDKSGYAVISLDFSIRYKEN